jgi:SAM-dependent methyltransferase
MTKQKQQGTFKTNWYDGWFYAHVIDPLSGKPFSRVIKKMIDPQDKVIEIGCGTGSLALSIADQCSEITGVDISPKMIGYAKKAVDTKSYSHIEFRLIEKNTHLPEIFHRKFDCAIAKMVLHETGPEIRNRMIADIKKISNYAILTDWVYPQPGGLSGLITRVIEYTAGQEHYQNFLSWCSLGGLDGFVKMHHLKVLREKIFKNGTGKILKVTWN